jgi:hypothetical protein
MKRGRSEESSDELNLSQVHVCSQVIAASQVKSENVKSLQQENFKNFQLLSHQK